MTIKVKQSLLAASIAVAVATPITGFATNGMNMEGWGPIATGMGGAAMAYDNGTAAVMNNVATLGLMADGESRLDVALGNLSPDISNDAGPGGVADSGGTSYFMPAVGYVKRTGQLTYGVGMFAQGGMGTEYGANTFMADPTQVPAEHIGKPTRSEVGVGRISAPIAYNVDKNLTIGGSIDYVWAGMDLQMAASQAQAMGMIQPSTTMDLSGAPAWDTAYFDFSDDSDYSGQARGAGFAAKVGFTYKVSNEISVGATYHTETNMGDLETSGSGASMTLFDTGTAVMPITGKIAVNDFQWPSLLGIGMSYKQDKFMIAADVKQVNWSDVMSSFNMTFSNAGGDLVMSMPQNWEDQTIVSVGGSYKMSSATTLRAGVNSSSNPVPNATLNPLFPATIETHYTLGVGHDLDNKSAVNFSLTIAPEVSATADTGITTTHAQTNWQLMYSQKF